MTPKVDQDEVSFPEISYPAARDSNFKSPHVWLQGRAMDDGAEGLWRIENKIYDFSEFSKVHPGGSQWLRMSKGIDITEAFESHHISGIPERMLDKYFVRNATAKRNSPFTFKEDGFYKTLKRRVREELKTIPKDLREKSKRIMEGITIVMFAFSIAACNVHDIWMRGILCLLAGLFMSWCMTCGHNFLHQKDNWRMYLFNFSLLSTREFRVTHALSHHMFPNTLKDVEMEFLEPMFQWLPRKSKSKLARYGPALYGLIVYVFIFDFALAFRIAAIFLYKDLSYDNLEDLVPLILPTIMYYASDSTLLETIVVWLIICHICSFITSLINLNAAHHHPDIFHDGDTPKKDRDWGVYQLNAVMDRVDINGSLFKVLTNFGDHGLHHLFPALDHAYHPELYPVFEKTCREFNTELKMSNALAMFLGSYRQLARTECKKV